MPSCRQAMQAEVYLNTANPKLGAADDFKGGREDPPGKT